MGGSSRRTLSTMLRLYLHRLLGRSSQCDHSNRAEYPRQTTENNDPMALLQSLERGEFASVTDDDALRLFATAFAAELSHLKNASPTVESSGTPPSTPANEPEWTPSLVLFPEDFTEVNRTLVSMLAVKWLLADDYDRFTSGQPSAIKLTRYSFNCLRRFLLDRNPSPAHIYALLVALAIDDIGKDPALTTALQEKTNTSINIEDHSDAVLHAAIAGLIPSLNAAPPSHQAAILQNLRIGAHLNISQIVQAETAAASLTILRPNPHSHPNASPSQPQPQGEDEADTDSGFNIKAVVTILDVAGAAAHRNPHGCAVMTEPVFHPYMETITLLDAYRTGSIASARICYDRILSYRANVLHRAGYDLLCPDLPEERALLRILCMGRVATAAEARVFQRALDTLDVAVRRDLVNGLNVDGVDDGVAVLPYYAPGILAEALRGFTVDADADGDAGDDEAVVRVLGAFLRFLARVFGGSRPRLGEKGGIVERDLAFALETVHGEGFREDPGVLAEIALPWEG